MGLWHCNREADCANKDGGGLKKLVKHRGTRSVAVKSDVSWSDFRAAVGHALGKKIKYGILLSIVKNNQKQTERAKVVVVRSGRYSNE